MREQIVNKERSTGWRRYGGFRGEFGAFPVSHQAISYGADMVDVGDSHSAPHGVECGGARREVAEAKVDALNAIPDALFPLSGGVFWVGLTGSSLASRMHPQSAGTL